MNFKNILQNKNTVKYCVIVGLIGIALIFLSDFFETSKEKGTDVKTTELKSDAEFCRELESDAEELIKSITGDVNVKVIITLESGTEYLYASDKNKNTDTKKNISGESVLNDEISDKSEESYIIIKTSDGEQPLLISALSPKVRGAAVVCDSGNVPEVAETIKDSLGTLLDIGESKISVSGRAYIRNEELQ